MTPSRRPSPRPTFTRATVAAAAVAIGLAACSPGSPDDAPDGPPVADTGPSGDADNDTVSEPAPVEDGDGGPSDNAVIEVEAPELDETADERPAIAIPASPLDTIDVADADGADEAVHLVAAAQAAGVTLPVPAGTVVVETMPTPVSEAATFLVPGTDVEDALHAIAAAYDAQGWAPTRERTQSTTGDSTTYAWEFATQPYGADYRAQLTAYQMDDDAVVLLSLFVPEENTR